MVALTEKEIAKKWHVTSAEVDGYMKRHKWNLKDKKRRQKARRRILASKISHEPGKEISTRTALGEWQVVYGTMRVGGVITFEHTDGTNGNNENYHCVVTIACHEITAVDKVFLDEEEVIFSGQWSTGIRKQDGTIVPAVNKIFKSVSLGTDGQSGNGDLGTNLPDE